MNHILRYIFFVLVVRPVILIILGINVRYQDRLLGRMPCIVAANHNSHLDTMVLMTLFPLRFLKKIRPVAASDYFLKNKYLAWFALKIIGIVPIKRSGSDKGEDILAPCSDALAQGDILIFFPEGTRGEPERLASFKSGIARLAEKHPDIPVIPVFMHGLGKALPKGEWLPVPFFCDAVVGEAVYWPGTRSEFMQNLNAAMKSLASEISAAPWE
ncbi:MAG: lysophospholipid acyltransferase family protein [Desulfococcaceae bacterium]